MNTKQFSLSHSSYLKGPASTSAPLPEVYTGVHCDFSDELEHASTLGYTLKIKYWDDEHEKHTCLGAIDDIENIDGVEYLKVSDGALVRLDRIVDLEIVN